MLKGRIKEEMADKGYYYWPLPGKPRFQNHGKYINHLILFMHNEKISMKMHEPDNITSLMHPIIRQGQ